MKILLETGLCYHPASLNMDDLVMLSIEPEIARLSQHLNYTSQFIDAQVEGIIVFDRDLRILHWNTAMEEISAIKKRS